MKNLHYILPAVVLFTAFTAITPTAIAQTTSLPECVFLKDLDEGAMSEDVRCLQKYLNTTEFKVSETGVGSPGQETNLYREGTKAAVQRWQKAHGLPASGFFGPMSRIKYYDLFTSTAPKPPTTVVSNNGQVITPTPVTNPKPIVTSSATDTAIEKMRLAHENIQKSKGELDDAEDNDDEVGDAEDLINEAKDFLEEAFYAYLDKETADAIDLAEDAYAIASKARKEIEGNSKDRGLTKVAAIVFDNETVVKLRFKGQEYVFTTTEKHKDDIIEEIMDEVDDNDLNEDDVEDKLDIDTEDRESTRNDKKFNDQDEAKEEMNDADDAFDEANDKIRQAEKDGEDTDEADDLMDEAEDLLDDAQDAYDEEDYDEALDLTEEARDLIRSALKKI